MMLVLQKYPHFFIKRLLKEVSLNNMIKYRNRILVPKLSNIDRGPVFGKSLEYGNMAHFFLIFLWKSYSYWH